MITVDLIDLGLFFLGESVEMKKTLLFKNQVISELKGMLKKHQKKALEKLV